jgi:HEAT repeat protein
MAREAGPEGETDADADAEPLDRLCRHARYAPDRADYGALVTRLDDADPQVRYRAVSALGAVPERARPTLAAADPDPIPALTARLDDGKGIRRHAVAALAALAPLRPADVPVADLRPLVAAGNHWVRSEAADALAVAFHHDPSGVDAVVSLLDHDKAAVRGTVAGLLADVAAAHPAAVRPAAPRLRERFTHDDYNRRPLGRAFAGLAPWFPDAVAPVAGGLRDAFEVASCRRALAALAPHYPEAVAAAAEQFAVRLLDGDREAATALSTLAAQRVGVRRSTVRTVERAGYWERVAALRALADADPAVGARRLRRPFYDDEDRYVRRAARLADEG